MHYIHARPSTYPRSCGEVAEWLNAPHSKCGIRATVSGVRIPPSPPPENSTNRKTPPLRRRAKCRAWDESTTGRRGRKRAMTAGIIRFTQPQLNALLADRLDGD